LFEPVGDHVRSLVTDKQSPPNILLESVKCDHILDVNEYEIRREATKFLATLSPLVILHVDVHKPAI